MANHKDSGHKQTQLDETLSALYQASKKSGNAKLGKNGDDTYIPEEIDLRILQAAKKAVSPAPKNISFLKRRWDIPASVAATIMLATLLFVDVKDEIPLPGNHNLPKPSFDSSFLQEEESEQANSSMFISSEKSRKREDNEQRVSKPESTHSTLNQKDAAITGRPSSFSAENLSKQDTAKTITRMPAGEASPLTKHVGEVKKSVREPTGLSASEDNLPNRAAASPSIIPSIESYKNKSNILQVPTEKNLADDAGLTIKPLNQEQWLKDIELLLEENKVAAANLSLKTFRSTYPEYKLDTFCSQQKRLTCQ